MKSSSELLKDLEKMSADLKRIDRTLNWVPVLCVIAVIFSII